MLPRQLCIEIDELRFRMDQFEHILDKYTMFNMDGRGVFLALTANEILLGQYMRHANDRDTLFNFQDNNIQMDVGGKTAFYLDDVDDNMFVGANAGHDLTPGIGLDGNILLGSRAGYSITDGELNVALGTDSLRLGNPDACVAIGYSALEDAGVTSGGTGNTAVGYVALQNMDTGTDNVAIGALAMWVSTVGHRNVAIGEEAMHDGIGNDNIAIGHHCMTETGAASQYNIGIGENAMVYNNAGDHNIGIGHQALLYNDDGNYNVAIGGQAGYGAAAAGGEAYSNNVLVGYQAGYGLDVGGNSNVILGYQAGLALTTGTLNVFLGYLAGSQETMGSHKLFIDNTNTATPLIYGEFDNDLVRINGDLDVTGAITGAFAHNLLSADHSDTLAANVIDGDVIIGNVTPAWSRLAIAIPAANVRNVLGIDNAELRPSWKTALDATNPADIAAAAAPGTSLIFSHRDHVHDHPAGLGVDLHHNQQHDVVGGDHTLTGAQWSLVGATALNTIGLIAPSSNPGAAAAVLMSTAAGTLTLVDLSLSNDLLLADGSVIGITGNERIQFNAAGTIQFLGADVLMGTEDGLGKLNFDEGTAIADGIVWGSDANKVTLYRSADDMLKTDDSLTVALGFNIGAGTAAPTGGGHFQGGTASGTPLVQIYNTTISGEFLGCLNSDGNTVITLNQLGGKEGSFSLYNAAPAVTISLRGDNGDGTLTGGLNVGTGTGAGTGQIVTSSKITGKGLQQTVAGTLTIAGGIVTIGTGTNYRIDTEGSAATDDLDTINGGAQGHFVIFRTLTHARDVTFKDGTGNLTLAGDFTLNSAFDRIVLVFDGTTWCEVSRSNNA